MKNTYILGGALAIIILLAGIANAAVLAPPVNQDIGLEDTQMPNVTVALCQACHPGAADVHHYMLSGGPGSGFVPTTTLGCLDCHPVISGQLTISKNCHDCHDGTPWTVNPNIDLAAIRGGSGRPHHNITKASASNIVDASYTAADRNCRFCHGDGFIDNYNDGHYVPTYNTSMVTPLADFKINSTIGDGREWGGCAACHDAGVEGAVPVFDNYDTHHYATSKMLGRQCNYCHVGGSARAEPNPDYSSDPNAGALRVWLNLSYPSYTTMFQWDTSMRHVEFRNNTIMTTMADPINGTGCEKCHSVRDLHNIETASPGRTIAETLADQIPGYGHIGNNSDCNGCHQGWAGAVTNPFPGPKAMDIDSVSPGVLTADVATDVTITGSGFVEDPYTTEVLVDDVPTAASVTETEIVVNVNLAAGVHNIVVQKDVATTALTMVVAVETASVANSALSENTLTITGTGFGARPDSVPDMGVFVTTTTGKGKNKVTTTVKADVVSWTGTKIVATVEASTGNSLTVKTLNGDVTTTISGGSGGDPTPTPTPKPCKGKNCK